MDKKVITANQLYNREMPVGIDVDTIIEIVPDKLLELLADKSARFSRFEVPGGRNAWEIVSRTQRQTLVHKAVHCIKQYFFSRGLPYAHLWYLPRGVESVFCFRVDCDGFTEESSIKTLELAHQYNITMTWYIDVGRWKKHLDFVTRLKNEGQDVQLHCYSHRQFRKKKVILEDIRKAMAELKKVGVHPNGYAAPFGTWSEELSEVLEELGFSYSSEFSLAYDEYPFYPAVKKKPSKVLQIPIHPICVGILIEAGFRPDEMSSYFLTTAQRLRLARLPIIIYGHPVSRLEKYPQVLGSLLEWANSSDGIWVSSIGEFVSWWRFRAHCSVKGFVTSESMHIETSKEDARVIVRVEDKDGNESFVDLKSGENRLRELMWQKVSNKINTQLVSSPLMSRTMLRGKAIIGKLKQRLLKCFKGEV